MGRIYKVVIVSGPTNSGKTTVGDLLARMLPKTVMIEMDAINLILRVLPDGTDAYARWRDPYVIEDLATLAVNWLDRDFDVILPGLFWKSTFEQLSGLIGERLGGRQVEFCCLILAPPLEVVLQDPDRRQLSEEMFDFIRGQYDEKLHEPGFGIVIDNQDQTPQETADLIARQIT